jgi:hypothetical protein
VGQIRRRGEKMRIFDWETTIFEEGTLECERLLAERGKISSAPPEGNSELCELWHRSDDLEKSLAAPGVIDEARRNYEQAKNREISIRNQKSLRRDQINRELEKINGPIISYLCECADQGISKLRGLIFFDRGAMTVSLDDHHRVSIRTNLTTIAAVRELLIRYKPKIKNLLHGSLAEIQKETETTAEEVNVKNLKVDEQIPMSPSIAREIELELKGESPGPIPPSVLRDAQRGQLQERWDDVLKKFNELTGR